MSGAICGTAALSYCNTSLPVNINPDSYKGRGILLGTMSGSGTWGYLKVPPSNNANGVELVLAQDSPVVECRSDETPPVALPGSATGLVRAVNTRFDIFDNNIVNNNQPCNKPQRLFACVERRQGRRATNSTRWVLPGTPFRRHAYNVADTATSS
jgi:hypothetical protein